MEGIGNINAAFLAGNESAQKAQKRKKTKKSKQDIRPSNSTDAILLDKLRTEELIEMAKNSLVTMNSVRPELVEIIQSRMHSGSYNDQKIFEAIAEKLLILLSADKSN